MSTICLLIRVKFFKYEQKIPGKLKICISQKQIDARDSLFQLYLKEAAPIELLAALHNLLVSILCHPTNISKLACPTDYSTCLACLMDPKESHSVAWNFKNLSDITEILSGLQYSFRMIYFTYCYNIAYNDGAYKPFSHFQIQESVQSVPFESFKQPSILSEVRDEQCVNGDVEAINQKDVQMLECEEEEIEITDNEGKNRVLMQ